MLSQIIRVSFCFFLISISFFSCQENRPKEGYTFFVAGHTYGHPMNFKEGLHPPFVAQIPYLNEYPKMKFGVLTGDVVARATHKYWNAYLEREKEFKLPIYIAPGNHDRGTICDSLYPEVQSFRLEDDLFFIFSTKNWNINEMQKNFLIKELDAAGEQLRNVFIFCHELIWWSPENQFKEIEINYIGHYPGHSNYWAEIHPILTTYPNQIYLFAGDLGASEKVTPYMYQREGNLHFIASGMGSGSKDNLIITEVSSSGIPKLKLMRFDENNIWVELKLNE